jgi:hypothetical protein
MTGRFITDFALRVVLKVHSLRSLSYNLSTATPETISPQRTI